MKSKSFNTRKWRRFKQVDRLFKVSKQNIIRKKMVLYTVEHFLKTDAKSKDSARNCYRRMTKAEKKLVGEMWRARKKQMI